MILRTAATVHFIMQRTKVAAIVSVGVFVASLDLFIVNIAFPDIQRDFHGTSLASLSWILNAYAIVFAALLVPAGRWADRTGRKRAFLIGLALFTLSSAACAAAPSVGVLIAARVAQAAGAALLMPTSLGLLLPEFPPERRQVAVGIWSAVGTAAAAAGPLAGGLLVQASWRWVFLVNVPIGVVAIAAGARTLREIREEDAERPDLIGAGLVTGAVAAVTLAIVEGSDWGWGDARTAGLFALAALLAAGVAARSARHTAPIIEPAVVRVRAFSVAAVAILLFNVAFAAMLLSNVLLLTQGWHEPILRAGLQMAPGPAFAALSAVPAAMLAQRIGPRWVGFAGTLLFAAGVGLLATSAGESPHYARDFLPGFVLGGMGVGFVLPSAQGAAAATLPATRLATGTALITMARQIGAALGVAILVAVIGTPSPSHVVEAFQPVWRLELFTVLAAGVAMVLVGRVGAPLPAPVAVRSPA
jgi:EmrB/QacA subfamily drug resistance transporter